VEMKQGILGVTENMPRFFIAVFSNFLIFFVNRKVCFEISRYENLSASVILCTAAPFCYVNVFAEKFNFSRVFATQSVVVENWKENMANEKLDSVVSYYGENICFECVITDHFDDLPLLLLAKRRLLVRPSNATLEAIQGQFDFEVI
jgi:phosphoserine phosphatase